MKRAIDQGLLEVDRIDIRDYAEGNHRVVDDTPYGGGSGMVLKPEPVVRAVEANRLEEGRTQSLLLTPQGECLTQNRARELSRYDQLILICGRYEGIDARVRELVVDQEISIGDYVLMGGEVAAMVLVEAVARYIPGVVGDPHSVEEDSFSSDLLEYPQYTRPRVYRQLKVPEVLLSGNHNAVERWRRREALRLTVQRRPERIDLSRLSREDQELLNEIQREEGEGR